MPPPDRTPPSQALKQWVDDYAAVNHDRYNSYLFSQSSQAVTNISVVPAVYGDDAPLKNGFEIPNTCFEENFKRYSRLFAFGEDLGKIGDVNPGFCRPAGEIR